MRPFRIAITGDFLNAEGSSAYGDLGYGALDACPYVQVHFIMDHAPRPNDPMHWETPDAIGIIFNFDGLKVYHSGDTEYDLRLRALKHENIQVAMVVINGAGGHMDAPEAALLVWQLGVKTAIPMQHILWKDFTGGLEATLDP